MVAYEDQFRPVTLRQSPEPGERARPNHRRLVHQEDPVRRQYSLTAFGVYKQTREGETRHPGGFS